MKSQQQLKAHHDITETRGFPSMEPISTPAPRTMTRVRSEDGLGKTCCASYRILRTETKKTLNLRDSEKECKSEQYWTILHTWISEANWCSKIRWLRSRDRSRIPHLWRALSREVVNWRPRDLDAEIGQSHGRKTDWKQWKRWNLTPNPRIYGGSLCTKVNTSELKVLSRFVIAWEVVWQKSRTKTSYHESCCSSWSCICFSSSVGVAVLTVTVKFLGLGGGRGGGP